jgi:hypothetical protein
LNWNNCAIKAIVYICTQLDSVKQFSNKIPIISSGFPRKFYKQFRGTTGLFTYTKVLITWKRSFRIWEIYLFRVSLEDIIPCMVSNSHAAFVPSLHLYVRNLRRGQRKDIHQILLKLNHSIVVENYHEKSQITFLNICYQLISAVHDSLACLKWFSGFFSHTTLYRGCMGKFSQAIKNKLGTIPHKHCINWT